MALRWALLASSLPLALAAESYKPTKADIENLAIMHYMGYTWTALVVACLIYRWSHVLVRHVRNLVNVNQSPNDDGRQRYWAIPNEGYAKVKKHLLMAPFWKKRHHREFKPSTATNAGTLPNRLQILFVLGYLIFNIVMCTYKMDWYVGKTFSPLVFKRVGIVATMNMVPLFLLAGRNNPLIYLLGISFDSYNLIHRWIGRIAVLEAVAHGLLWAIPKYNTYGWHVIQESFAANRIYTGTIGVSAFLVLLLTSPSIIRKAFYEVFLGIHVLMAALACGGLWYHLEGLPFQSILLAVIVLWIFERCMRFMSLLRRNIGRSSTKAEIEALPGDAVRVTLHIANPWKFKPGQHIYMYMPSVGLWTSHPFSLAWGEDQPLYPMDPEKGLAMEHEDILAANKTSMSLIIRRRTGFTNQMFQKAENSPTGKFTTTAFVEGPYGSQSFASYGTVMLYAAGVGITHQVPHVRDLLAQHNNGTCATRKVVLVWIIQSPEHLEWIRPWMTQILAMENRREVLKILLFVTRPRSTKEIHSPSASVQMFPGKPDVAALLEKEQETQVGAMAVSVCGTGSLADDVRYAVRERCEKTEIDFFEEAFSW